MMRTILLTALLLAGCASQPASDPRVSEFEQWRESAHAQVKQGKMTWLAYYLGSYDRLNTMPQTKGTAAHLKTLSQLIPIARKYDAGELTYDQFSDARRIVLANLNANITEIEAAQQEAREAAALDAIRSSAPALRPYQPAVPAPSQPVNCTSTVSGSLVTTTCR
jgi:PBP1b-binding outer membrane lipoprotein LpoB